MIHVIRNVLPGDKIDEKGFKSYGIKNNTATVVGQLCRIEECLFIKSKADNYHPGIHDVVVGKVNSVYGDCYRIKVNEFNAVLPSLSFKNATKKSRPDLQRGDLVLAQVVKIEGDELMLSCQGEGMGPIEEAFRVAPHKIRLLYFSEILKGVPGEFKVALAINGYIYIEGVPEVKERILHIIDNL